MRNSRPIFFTAYCVGSCVVPSCSASSLPLERSTAQESVSFTSYNKPANSLCADIRI